MTKIKAREYRILKCPFCGKGNIEILYVPASTKTKKGSYGGYKSGVTEVSEHVLFQTDKCPNCGKSKGEIKKAMEIGSTKKMSHEERLKRLKEAGLPTRIES